MLPKLPEESPKEKETGEKCDPGREVTEKKEFISPLPKGKVEEAVQSPTEDSPLKRSDSVKNRIKVTLPHFSLFLIIF